MWLLGRIGKNPHSTSYNFCTLNRILKLENDNLHHSWVPTGWHDTCLLQQPILFFCKVGSATYLMYISLRALPYYREEHTNDANYSFGFKIFPASKSEVDMLKAPPQKDLLPQTARPPKATWSIIAYQYMANLLESCGTCHCIWLVGNRENICGMRMNSASVSKVVEGLITLATSGNIYRHFWL